jgi:hypothetical protein
MKTYQLQPFAQPFEINTVFILCSKSLFESLKKILLRHNKKIRKYYGSTSDKEIADFRNH